MISVNSIKSFMNGLAAKMPLQLLRCLGGQEKHKIIFSVYKNCENLLHLCDTSHFVLTLFLVSFELAEILDVSLYSFRW